MRWGVAALLLLSTAACQGLDGPRPAVALNVPFAPGSWGIYEAGAPVLDAAANALADTRLRGSRYVVRAYAAPGGNPGEALALSRLRAAAVVDQLVARGFPRERLQPEGMGADQGGERVEIVRR
jgi:outer membrane protein OmpA-like peptidoglycan-associated protein